MAYTDFAFTIFRGDDATIALTAFQEDGETPQDITGWTLWCTGKVAILDPDESAVFQRKTGGAGITITDGEAGAASIALVPASTDSLAAVSTELFCDVQGQDGTGKVRTLATGKLTVLAEITRVTS